MHIRTTFVAFGQQKALELYPCACNILVARGPTHVEIPNASIEIRGRNPKNLEILVFANSILLLNLASRHRNVYLLVPINIYLNHFSSFSTIRKAVQDPEYYELGNRIAMHGLKNQCVIMKFVILCWKSLN